MRMRIVLGILFVSAVGFAAKAEAGLFQNGTGLAAPVSTITFDEHALPVDTIVTTEYSDLGLTVSPGAFFTPETGFAGITGNNIGNFSSTGAGPIDPITLTFSGPQNGAAFAMAGDDTPFLFEALLNGVVIDSGTLLIGAIDPSMAFVGFSGETLDAIRITQAGAGGGPYYLIDNVQLGSAINPVPEPSTVLGLACAGLVSIAALRRRKSRA